MGCGSSTPGSVPAIEKTEQLAPGSVPAIEKTEQLEKTASNGQNGILELETEENEINIVFSERNYPEPKSSPLRKNECFNVKQMKIIDSKAKQAPDSYVDSYETLLEYLTEDCKTELEKLRSIFSWFGAQYISKAIYPTAKLDTPKGFLNLLQLQKQTYASFFAKLCRSAGLPCVIVSGLGKSVAYEVGDKHLERLRNQWNTVYVDGAWRIVHPRWAFSCIVGHNTGAWALLETEGNQVNERQSAAEGFVIQQVNEFFFLTDSDHFICSSFPDDPKWQLLSKQWTIEQFVSVPYFDDAYHLNGLQVLSTYNCRLTSEDGICEIEFDVPKSLLLTGYALNYSLYGEDNALASILEEGVQLAKYVFLNKIDNRFVFEVRFPLIGKYKIHIQGNTGDVCQFLIECGQAQANCKPLPILPEIGWGPGNEIEKIGLKATTHTNGSVAIKKNETVKIRFNITKRLEIRSELVHSTIAQSDLQSCVAQQIKKKNVEFSVTVPEEGEFALQLFARKAKSMDQFKNFCNYLLRPADGHKRKKTKEDARDRNIRKILKMQIEQEDISKLEYIIDVFEQHHLDDKGDVTAAKYQLQFLILRKGLRDAIMRRQIEILENVINDANNSSHKTTLESWIKKAVVEMEALRRFNRLGHAILEMKQATISEIRSYKRPPVAVERVMMATFTILGEKEEWIQNWENVQSLIGKTGRDSLKRRVQTFDMSKASVAMADDACQYTKKYDTESVREVSCGAATFYVWTENIIQEIRNRADS